MGKVFISKRKYKTQKDITNIWSPTHFPTLSSGLDWSLYQAYSAWLHLTFWIHAYFTKCMKTSTVGVLSVSMPQLWPWSFPRDQCHVSSQLWRTRERDLSCMWRSKVWFPYNKHLIDMRVCMNYMYVCIYIPGVGVGEVWGWWLILHPECFWSLQLVRDARMVPLCPWDQLCYVRA